MKLADLKSIAQESLKKRSANETDLENAIRHAKYQNTFNDAYMVLAMIELLEEAKDLLFLVEERHKEISKTNKCPNEVCIVTRYLKKFEKEFG